MAKEIDPKEFKRFDLAHYESKCYLSPPGLSAIEVMWGRAEDYRIPERLI
ncbi:MAG: hypothetical protein JSU85_05680 [Candidatus Zixiibacteriota bacterium]|nr:MAG: hypothetical protein JSU85_05680 [candidate division Zixibacteria bacterium]